MAEQKRKEGVYAVIKEEQKNWRGWELHLVCAGLIEEEGEQEWSFFALMVSPFQSFSSLFPLLCDNKSDFLPLRLLLWCFNGENAGIRFLPSRLCPLFSQKVWIQKQIWMERAKSFDKIFTKDNESWLSSVKQMLTGEIIERLLM